MFYIIWRFRAKAEKVEEFQKTYAADGDWSRLFARASGYQGTELLADTSDPRVFVVIDRWETRAAHEGFRSEYGAEYKALDEACCELTDEETEIGQFWGA